MTRSQILTAAMKLSADERLVLLQGIENSLKRSSVSDELSAAQKLELTRRIREHRRNPEEGISWEDLKKKMRPKRQRRTA